MTVESKPQALKYKAHVRLPFRCGTILISSPITEILSHTQALVGEWGTKPFFCLQPVFFLNK
jgi:hypothetical protein